jgi:hypothetical protein
MLLHVLKMQSIGNVLVKLGPWWRWNRSHLVKINMVRQVSQANCLHSSLWMCISFCPCQKYCSDVPVDMRMHIVRVTCIAVMSRFKWYGECWLLTRCLLCVQDYFVLLPAAFYEATVLVDQVYTPCEVGNKGLCRHFIYPNLTQFDMVRGGGGYRIVNEERKPLDVYFRDEQVTFLWIL